MMGGIRAAITWMAQYRLYRYSVIIAAFVFGLPISFAVNVILGCVLAICEAVDNTADEYRALDSEFQRAKQK